MNGKLEWTTGSKERSQGKGQGKTGKTCRVVFDLAKLSFAGLVVGGIVSMKPDVDITLDIYRVIIGGISTIILLE